MAEPIEEHVIQAASEAAAREIGIASLKNKQIEAITSFITGQDTFVSLSTGYGKSVIYALLPLVFDRLLGHGGSIVVCISPLTALMMDQRDKFTKRGITTDFVGEMQTDQAVIKRVLNGNIQLVYISPEALLLNPMYRNMLLTKVYKEHLVALVIDEAHCVKTWGDNFRTAFARIGELRSIIPSKVKIMALTATTTKQVFETVVDKLSMKDVKVINMPPQRKNITLIVRQIRPLLEFLNELASEIQTLKTDYPKTIIFCRTYSDCSAVFITLQDLLGEYFSDPPGYPIDMHEYRLVDTYTRANTAGMKEKVLASFSVPNGKLRVVVATTAFSMGIDCPDIHQIIHYGSPSSPEDYVQEIGRAGRDNIQSKAILMFGKLRNVGESMRKYGENKTQCRQQMLYKQFIYHVHEQIIPMCVCCDICAEYCNCDRCK